MDIARVSSTVLNTAAKKAANVAQDASQIVQKTAQASANEALGAMGRALVNISQKTNADEILSSISQITSKETLDIADGNEVLKLVRKITENLSDPAQSAKSKDLIKAIEKAIEEKDFGKLKRVENALNILQQGDKYSGLEQLASTLNDVYNKEDGFYTKSALNEFLTAFFGEGKITPQRNEKGIFIAQVDGVGTLSARAKSKKSILSKLRNKVIDLKADLPTDNTSGLKLIGDAQGIRFNVGSFNFSKMSADELSKSVDDIVETFSSVNESVTERTVELLNENKDEFINFIKGKKVSPELEKAFLEALSFKQSEPYVEKLAEAIQNGDIMVSEINNYSSIDGIPYLHGSQIQRLKKAYSQWYNKAKGDAENLGFEVLKSGVLIKNGVKFPVDLPIVSQTLTETSSEKYQKAIKPNGYTAAQFNFLSKNGHQGEFQLRGSLIDEIAESEHIVYDSKAQKDTVVNPIFDKIKEAIRKMRDEDSELVQYNKYYNEVFKAYRKQELGIPAVEPDIRDYVKFDFLSDDDYHVLSKKGVIELHELVQRLKEEGKL